MGRSSHALATLWLALASLFFYGWWDVRYVALLLASIVFYYFAGALIARARHGGDPRLPPRHPREGGDPRLPGPRALLATAIAANLGLLAYYKYANFFVDNLNQLAGFDLTLATVILPLGISFYTFTQIAFLVDTFQGKVKEFNFFRYALFVTYFPHLIAGPVLHHAEMMPQFARKAVCRIDWQNVAVGLSIFVLGLAKKVLLADSIAEFASPVFDGVKAGAQPMLFEAWVGALAYTLQLYLDFSAYSDMAIGLSLMFNVRLPLNFDSPYKATSIIDFWRRWHMTLSRFLRDYLYIPLGGGRAGTVRRYANLMITMVLGGLWHGAGWTFVVWGTLHGFYLLVNHAWRAFRRRHGWGEGGRAAAFVAGALTFLAVVVGWVFFRADSMASAVTMLQGMTGMHGVAMADKATRLFSPGQAVGHLVLGFAIVWCLPNVHQIFRSYRPVCGEGSGEDVAGVRAGRSEAVRSPSRVQARLAWKPSRTWAWFTGLLCVAALLNLTRVSEFLYFQF